LVVALVMVTVATQVDRVLVRTMVVPETLQIREYLDEIETLTVEPLGTVNPTRVAADDPEMRLALDLSVSV